MNVYVCLVRCSNTVTSNYPGNTSRNAIARCCRPFEFTLEWKALARARACSVKAKAYAEGGPHAGSRWGLHFTWRLGSKGVEGGGGGRI